MHPSRQISGISPGSDSSLQARQGCARSFGHPAGSGGPRAVWLIGAALLSRAQLPMGHPSRRSAPWAGAPVFLPPPPSAPSTPLAGWTAPPGGACRIRQSLHELRADRTAAVFRPPPERRGISLPVRAGGAWPYHWFRATEGVVHGTPPPGMGCLRRSRAGRAMRRQHHRAGAGRCWRRAGRHRAWHRHRRNEPPLLREIACEKTARQRQHHYFCRQRCASQRSFCLHTSSRIFGQPTGNWRTGWFLRRPGEIVTASKRRNNHQKPAALRALAMSEAFYRFNAFRRFKGHHRHGYPPHRRCRIRRRRTGADFR